MSGRYAPLIVILLGLVLGFVHAALTFEIPPRPAVVHCYEDGSCTDGYCEPFAGCDDSREQ